MTDQTTGAAQEEGGPGPAAQNAGYVVPCHNCGMGYSCPEHDPRPEQHKSHSVAPVEPLTDRQQLAALDAYLKALKPIADALRAKVEGEMAAAHDERVGAFLPDGTKLASITRSDGKKTVKVTDDSALLAWCKRDHPEHVYTIEAVRPAYLKLLMDVAGSLPMGSKGLDPSTGRELPFIEVQQGAAYVTVTATPDGKQRMRDLAHGFGRTLTAAPEPAPAFPANDPYDPSFADRLENGAYGG